MKINSFILLLLLPSLLLSQDNRNEFEILATNYESQGKLMEAGDFFNKAGYTYWNKGEVNKATEVFEKAYQLFSKQNNFNACLTINNNLGLVYSEMEQYKNAEKAFSTALQLARKINNQPEILSALVNICNVKIELHDYADALVKSKEALALATEQNNLKLMAKCYSLLAEAYEKTGEASMAFKNYELFSAIDKNIKSAEMANVKNLSAEEISFANEGKRVTEIELKIKKGELKLTQDSLLIAERIAFERQIENNNINARLRQKELQLKYEKNLRTILIIGISIILIFLGLLALLFKQKIRDNILLKQQKEEITDQKNKLDVQNKKITDSIHYGLRIQQAMLPNLEALKEAFDLFIIYNAKDIVSGDFYWYFEMTHNQQVYKYIAVVDCTGHGVPGAFMSMIGNRLLNEVVIARKNYDPGNILQLLEEILRKELHQDISQNRDGMDISLCRLAKIEHDKYELVYAGAKRPMLVYYNEQKKIEILEGDNKTIGSSFSELKRNFTEKRAIISKGDSLILYSDGIIDQHNKNRMRFGTGRFVELLEKSLPQPLNECRDAIDNAFNSFRELEEQRDDITILGLRIK